jgi:hypothetical protein
MPGKADTDHPCQAKLLRSFDGPTTNSRLRDRRPVSLERQESGEVSEMLIHASGASVFDRGQPP